MECLAPADQGAEQDRGKVFFPDFFFFKHISSSSMAFRLLGINSLFLATARLQLKPLQINL